ncbi:Card1-like endonuclease domain-containing protein [uncultured Cohaesibacter sp.]|uniref:Card1-like endonuclease domain-containing protein n=1 Tax=uncultured Cohaesibacter sp. TaxID=1002546 RepID=UPI00292E4DA0|nr:DUF1887 family CARF protein [uncultured Cohaesibacter sp.]
MTIAQLIKQNGARLDPLRTGDISAAKRHKDASILISSHYNSFERIRKRLFNGSLYKNGLSPSAIRIVAALEDVGLVGKMSDGGYKALTAESRRFITGGWLEEVSCLASNEAGADEVLFGQQIKWHFDDYFGENEIDVIARFGQRLAFYSCKAYSATYRNKNDRGRKKLMEALHEADNLVDHFGSKESYVGLILSTDLYDEYARKPKYEALFGKAKALNVDLITLEDLEWNKLVKAMSRPKRQKQ